MMMQKQLWIGELLPYMNESFILSAFNKMCLPRPLSVKLLRRKFTGDFAGYGFINFQTHEEMLDAMYKLNGRLIPGSVPPSRFYLNMTMDKGEMSKGKHFAVWVAGLSADVDDYALNRTFSRKYTIVKSKVLYHESGISKGYGLVKFSLENEHRHALRYMNGHVGLGTKPLHVFSAVLKPKMEIKKIDSKNSNSDKDLNEYYDPSDFLKEISELNSQSKGHNTQNQQQSAVAMSKPKPTSKSAPAQNADSEVVNYKRPFDVDIADSEFLNPDLSLWDSLEYSQWFPYDIVESH